MTQSHSITDVESVVTNSWTDFVGVANTAPDANFFAIGGNSLEAAELMAKLSRELGRRLRLRLLLQNPTLGGLIAAVSGEMRTA